MSQTGEQQYTIFLCWVQNIYILLWIHIKVTNNITCVSHTTYSHIIVTFVPTDSPSHGVGATVYVWHKPTHLSVSLPTPFLILFLCLFLSLWPFQLYLIPCILQTTYHFPTILPVLYLIFGPVNLYFFI